MQIRETTQSNLKAVAWLLFLVETPQQSIKKGAQTDSVLGSDNMEAGTISGWWFIGFVWEGGVGAVGVGVKAD